MQLRLALRQLAATPWLTLFKTVTLAVGLLICTMLLSSVAQNLNWNRCFPHSERIYTLRTHTTVSGEEQAYDLVAPAIAQGVAEAMPELVTAGCTGVPGAMFQMRIADTELNSLRVGAWVGDFIGVTGVELLHGNPEEDYKRADVVYLSDELARRMYGSPDSAVGRTVGLDPTGAGGMWLDMGVAGVFKAIGQSTVASDVLICGRWLERLGAIKPGVWDGNENWHGMIRLAPGADPQEVTRRMNPLYQSHAPDSEAVQTVLELRSLRDAVMSIPAVRRSTWLFGTLALLIMAVTALNYALLELSALRRRGRTVGVLKCAGASGGGVMGLFALETAIVTVGAVILAGVALWGLLHMEGDSPVGLFLNAIGPERLWVPAAALAVIFLTAVVIPGVTLARVPVTTVFRGIGGSRHRWSTALLGVQLCGTAVAASMAVAVMRQYDDMVYGTHGYDLTDTIVVETGWGRPDQARAVMEALRAEPWVEAVTSANYVPGQGDSGFGNMASDADGNRLFLARRQKWDAGLPEFARMRIVAGAVPPDVGNLSEVSPRYVAVNEEYARRMRLTPAELVGRTVYDEEGVGVEVCAVVQDFLGGNYFHGDINAMIMYLTTEPLASVMVRTAGDPADALARVRQIAEEAVPDLESVELYTTAVAGQYVQVRQTAVLCLWAVAVMVALALGGMLAYVRNEVQRRSKEIAIRKVNGAEALDVVELIAGGVMCTCLAAVMVGSVPAWIAIRAWTEQFEWESVNPLWCVVSGCVAVTVITLAAVTLLTLRTARANPVESLRSE